MPKQCVFLARVNKCPHQRINPPGGIPGVTSPCKPRIGSGARRWTLIPCADPAAQRACHRGRCAGTRLLAGCPRGWCPAGSTAGGRGRGNTPRSGCLGPHGGWRPVVPHVHAVADPRGRQGGSHRVGPGQADTQGHAGGWGGRGSLTLAAIVSLHVLRSYVEKTILHVTVV